MDISIRRPARGAKILYFLICIAIILVISLVFIEVFAKSLFDLPSFAGPSDNLSITQGNTLRPQYNPLPEPKPIQTLKMVVTAYSSTVWQTDSTPFITASGSYVEEGIVANNLLPFGTKVRIPEIYGNKIFVVEDRMNQRVGYYHLDIWFPDYWEAKSFGAKSAYIEILES